MGACAVLHVTSLLGGGVDRHIRDIARGVPRPHLFWHAAENAEVIEDKAHPLMNYAETKGKKAAPDSPA